MDRRFKFLLDTFLSTSRRLVNKGKRFLFGWNIHANLLSQMAQIFRFTYKLDCTSFKYIRMPIIKSSPKSKLLLGLIKKMKKNINQWGSQWLNIVGQVILIKSILSSLPVYQFVMLQMQAGILNELDILIRKFLW